MFFSFFLDSRTFPKEKTSAVPLLGGTFGGNRFPNVRGLGSIVFLLQAPLQMRYCIRKKFFHFPQ